MSGGFVVEIDRLVVGGVAGSERRLAALAFQREFERLVADRGIPEGLNGGELAVLEAELDVAGDDGAAMVGAEAARALYGALAR